MKRFLLIALTAGLLSPIAAKAETHWLVLHYRQQPPEAVSSLETIKMPSAEVCEREGRRWEKSPTHGDRSILRRFHCVIGE